MGLLKLFDSGIAMPDENRKELEIQMNQGQIFFEQFNLNRLKIAFEAFDPDMKSALYEVLFFLHVNDSRFEAVKYKATRIERVSGLVRENTSETTANLFQHGVRHGVVGFSNLSAVFVDDFKAYIQKEFNYFPPSNEDLPNAIVSISTLGSIGTVGHKSLASDLDLQLLYNLNPFLIPLHEWDDERLKEAIQMEIKNWINRICVQRKLVPAIVSRNRTLYLELQQQATLRVAKAYPYLYQTLFQNKDFTQAMASPKGKQLKMNFIQEMTLLILEEEKADPRGEKQRAEQALKERIKTIQDYIQAKFPKAEIYLFSCSTNSYRQGKHGTTLESKEASGSAYELILNYDVLIPGIQITSAIPAHYIISRDFNNSKAFYERILQYIRFRAIPTFSSIENRLMDCGATPTMKLTYMLSHVGAAYWESFKATSGNLAKALMNLFRIECLYNPKYLYSITELIKYPQQLQLMLQNEIDLVEEDTQKNKNFIFGVSVRVLLELEKLNPLLRFDPWWIKYKILKIFYQDLEIKLEKSEQRKISRILDLCFSLHIQLKDAMRVGSPTVKPSYRMKFLQDYLRIAFPKNTPQRVNLEHILYGDITTILHFEADMKDLFANCLDRIHRVVVLHDIPDGSNQSEFEIWYHYFKQTFSGSPKEVARNIMTHLKIPRRVIKIRHEKSRRRGGWVFHASAKYQNKTDNIILENLDGIPEESDLIYEKSFLKGFAHCILNGYYGLMKSGSLQETKTQFHIDASTIDLGNTIDNVWSISDSEALQRIADRIVGLFPYRKTHYLDVVKQPRKITELFFFMNLFKFGRLSILYRDNRQTWEVDEFDLPSTVNLAQEYFDNFSKFLQATDLHSCIDDFLRLNKVNLTDKLVKTTFWYNALSTGHSPSIDQKTREKNFSWQFQDYVTKEHGTKNYSV